MKTTFISSRAITDANRYHMMRMQIELNKLEKEIVTGRAADTGIHLGSRAGQSVSLEDVMAMFSDMGINVVENEEEADEDEKEQAQAQEDEVDPLDDGGPKPAAATKKEPVDRTDEFAERYEDWVSLEREPRTLRRPLCGQCG
jgi:hypothetical protein